MKTVGVLGSCLAGLTAVMLAGDYRWTRLNNAPVDRSDLFVRYMLRGERMPSREFVEMVLAVAPDHAAAAREIFRRMYSEGVGLAELPPTTRPLFENLERARFDLLLLDNQFDTHNIKCNYRSPDGRVDFDFNFPVHWCERRESLTDAVQYSPCLEPAESARNWAEIVRYLRSMQPAAHIMFLCAPSSTIEHDVGRRARADGFEPALRAALGDTDVEIVPQLQIPRALSKLPDDEEHLDLQVYRALAGRAFTSCLMARQPAPARAVADAA